MKLLKKTLLLSLIIIGVFQNKQIVAAHIAAGACATMAVISPSIRGFLLGDISKQSTVDSESLSWVKGILEDSQSRLIPSLFIEGALKNASKNGHLDLVELILDRYPTKQNIAIVLQTAAQYNHKIMVKDVLNKYEVKTDDLLTVVPFASKDLIKELVDTYGVSVEHVASGVTGKGFEGDVKKLLKDEYGMHGPHWAYEFIDTLRLVDRNAAHQMLDALPAEQERFFRVPIRDCNLILSQAVRGNHVDLVKHLLRSGMPLSKQFIQEFDTYSAEMKAMLHRLFNSFPDLQSSPVILYGQLFTLNEKEISDHNTLGLLTMMYATNGDQYVQFHGMRALMNKDISVIDHLLESRSQLFYTVCAQYFDTYEQFKQYFEKLDPKYAPFVKKAWFGKGDVEQRFDHAKQDLQHARMVPLYNFSKIMQKVLKKDGMLSKRTQLPKAVVSTTLGMNKLGIDGSQKLDADALARFAVSRLS